MHHSKTADERRNRITPKQSDRKGILPAKHEQLDGQLDAQSTKIERVDIIE